MLSLLQASVALTSCDALQLEAFLSSWINAQNGISRTPRFASWVTPTENLGTLANAGYLAWVYHKNSGASNQKYTCWAEFQVRLAVFEGIWASFWQLLGCTACTSTAAGYLAWVYHKNIGASNQKYTCWAEFQVCQGLPGLLAACGYSVGKPGMLAWVCPTNKGPSNQKYTCWAEFRYVRASARCM